MTEHSELNNLIPPEKVADEFWHIIKSIAFQSDVNTILEIGSSSGEGSTSAVVQGALINPSKPKVFCLEVSSPRFQALQKRYANYPFVYCYNASSVSLDDFPTEQEIANFYSSHQSALNNYPLERVIGWLRQDIAYLKENHIEVNAIDLIKKQHSINHFDMVIIDGSEFTGEAELKQVYGAKYILLDDIKGFKNYNNFLRLYSDRQYALAFCNVSLRNGYAVFVQDIPNLIQSLLQSFLSQKQICFDEIIINPIPINFFTIVLNGMPFIRHHVEVFKHLPFKWHWHIIEGVADLKHDTAWSLKRGGVISEQLHSHGLSNDGTTEYLDELKKLYPHNITIYRKPNGEFWHGKLEMVNAPLSNIHNDCLLFQIDSDELWSLEQLCAVQWMFRQYPQKTAAFYYCHFFVSEKLVTITKNTYGNHTSYEWLRTWRFKPGDFWLSHEPPRLCRRLEDGQVVDIATVNPFTHLETEYRGLIFQHYAYGTEPQLRFKELYYGYCGAVESWAKLQQNKKFPVFLKDYFNWVTDNTLVSTVTSENISPLANKCNYKWQFNLFSSPTNFTHGKDILWVRTDSIGDSILNMFMLPYIKQRFNDAKITVLCQNHIKELYEPCPAVDEIITFDRTMAYQDEHYRLSLINTLQSKGFDLVINPIHSSDELTHLFAISSTIKDKIAFEGDLCNIKSANKKLYMPYYTHLIKSASLPELNRYKEFLQALGLSSVEPFAEIWLTQEDIEFAENLFKSHSLDSTKTIALFAGAQWKVRLYSQYGEALRDVCKLYGFDVIALGSDKDFEINEQNLKATQARYFNLSGKTTLRQSAAILSKCRLACGAETGLAHIACAVETPNVILLGGGHFGRFMPYSHLTSIVCLPLQCYWCNWGGCKYEQNYCISDIMPNVLTTAIFETLKSVSDKARVFIQGRSLYTETPTKPKWQDCAKFLTGNVSLIQVDTNATEASKVKKSN